MHTFLNMLMRRADRRIIWAILLTAFLLLIRVFSVSAQESVVEGVMFWQKGCPHCEQVISETLPAVNAQFPGQFKLEMIEVSDLEDVDRLYAVGAAYGLAKEDIGVPFMVIGENVMVGSKQIPAELPGVIEKYLAKGGVKTVLRDSAVQPEPVSAATDLPAAAVSQSVLPANESASNGIWLAWVTIAGLAAALLAAIWQVVAALQGQKTLTLPAWMNMLVPVLAVLGSFVAIYLTFIETTKAKAICGPVGDCNAVQNSPYALLFGLIPVGLVGLIGYIAILAAWFWNRYRQDLIAEYTPIAQLGMTLIGVVYSIYLTYLEIFVIHAVCIWCISSAWIMAFLLLLCLPAAAEWVSPEDSEETA